MQSVGVDASPDEQSDVICFQLVFAQKSEWRSIAIFNSVQKPFKSVLKAYVMYLTSNYTIKLNVAYRAFLLPYFLFSEGVVELGIIKEKSMAALMSGLRNFENSKDEVKNTDFKSFETFIKQYLNTPDKKQRLKIAEEFKKRHLELYEFLKSNSELVNAESEITKTLKSISDSKAEDNSAINKLDDILRGIKDEF